MESEMVKELGKEDGIDRSYYDKLVDEAVKTISQYGDFEWFVSDDPYVPELGANDADVDCVVPWAMPCGEDKYRTCFDCPHFNNDNFHMDCDLDYDILRRRITMEHSKNYSKVKLWYSMKMWNETRVRNAVKMGWITKEEFAEITGKDYE